MTYSSTITILSTFVLFYIISLQGVEGLECYVCTKQEGNTEKCLTTVKTCEHNEDTCLSELRWGSTPYWNQGAEKQYYVTKKCSNRTFCENLRSTFTPYCHRIWYEDWKCAECCQGDRCNYYIVLGASNLKVNWIFLSLSFLVASTALRIYLL